MALNKKDLISLMGDVAVELGVPEEKRDAASIQCFNSMARSHYKIDREENALKKSSGLAAKSLLSPEEGLVNYLGSLSDEILAISLVNNIRPFVPLYEIINVIENLDVNQNGLDFKGRDTGVSQVVAPGKVGTMPEYVPDPEFRAQTAALREMTDILNASFAYKPLDQEQECGAIADNCNLMASGSWSGKVLDVANGVVTQRVNRAGDVVLHDAGKLSAPVKVGDVVDISYVNGVGMVGGLDKGLGGVGI